MFSKTTRKDGVKKITIIVMLCALSLLLLLELQREDADASSPENLRTKAPRSKSQLAYAPVARELTSSGHDALTSEQLSLTPTTRAIFNEFSTSSSLLAADDGVDDFSSRTLLPSTAGGWNCSLSSEDVVEELFGRSRVSAVRTHCADLDAPKVCLWQGEMLSPSSSTSSTSSSSAAAKKTHASSRHSWNSLRFSRHGSVPRHSENNHASDQAPR